MFGSCLGQMRDTILVQEIATRLVPSKLLFELFPARPPPPPGPGVRQVRPPEPHHRRERDKRLQDVALRAPRLRGDEGDAESPCGLERRTARLQGKLHPKTIAKPARQVSPTIHGRFVVSGAGNHAKVSLVIARTGGSLSWL